MDPYHQCVTVLLVMCLCGLAWSVWREFHIHAMNRAQERTHSRLTEHLHKVGFVLEDVVRQVQSSSSLTREQLRDMEERIHEAIKDNRAMIRDGIRPTIFNTNAHGGQTNQGGSVQSDQRQP